jgi:RNA:NAD 2'-phosphotransferase (TPT1/KptA family)
MIFYHGTSKENWEAIQQEGILFGRLLVNNKEVSRCTYLAVDLEEAKCYGEVVLKVEYDPYKHKKMNNYIEDCWQLRVYEPIPLTDIKVIKQ